MENTLPPMLNIWKLSRSRRTITPTDCALQTFIFKNFQLYQHPT